MKRYTGIACVHCPTKFQDNDDVVVCPICGAPHHRDCYNELGRCALSDRHANGEVWQPPGNVAPSEARGEQVVCPNCMAPNPKSSQYCQMCGTKLHTTMQDRREPPIIHEGGFTPPPGTVYTGNVDNTDQWELQGVSAREISTYIGNNSHYYFKQFRSIQMKSTGWSWNWSAFLFGPFYFLYRKLYLLGGAVLALYILSYIPAGIYIFEYSKMIAPDYGGLALAYNLELMNTMVTVFRIGQIIVYTLMGLQALYANRLFMQKVLKDIKEIRQQMPHEAGSREYYAQLYFAGRPNRMVVLVAIFIMFTLFSMLFQHLQSVVQIPLQS